MRLADGRVFAGPLAPERHRALQLGVLHEQTDGLVELAAGARRDGRLQITTRRRADHFLPGGGPVGESGCGRCSALAGAARRRAARRCSSPRPSARRRAATSTRSARPASCGSTSTSPAQLPALWAFLAERPCHLLVESGGSGRRRTPTGSSTEPLPATRVIEATGELVEPIERAHLRLIHHLGIGADGKPNVADPACAERSRVMRLAGSVNGKTGAHARILEADLALPGYPIRQLVGDLPDPRRRSRRAPSTRGRRARTRTSGSARASTSSGSPGSSSRATGSCAARPPATRTGIPSCSVGTRREPGVALPRRRLRGARARSTTSPRCCSAGRGARSCAARRSSAPART